MISNFILLFNSTLDLSGTEDCRSHWSLCISECERTMCVRKCKEKFLDHPYFLCPGISSLEVLEHDDLALCYPFGYVQ